MKSNSSAREELGLEQSLMCFTDKTHSPRCLAHTQISPSPSSILPSATWVHWIRRADLKENNFLLCFFYPLPTRPTLKHQNAHPGKKGRNRTETLGQERGHPASGQPVLAPVSMAYDIIHYSFTSFTRISARKSRISLPDAKATLPAKFQAS